MSKFFTDASSGLIRRFFFRAWVLKLVLLSGLTGSACTIFVLVDSNHALFFNNEDWSNTTSRVWFIPGGEGRFGGVYVGFDDGWTQGGMNTEGLACDWVAGVNEKWEIKAGMKRARGNPSQRMLESCSTLQQAIDFFRSYYEPGFSSAEIMVGDRTGASAIIGAVDGELRVRKSTETRGFGYGGRTLQNLLKERPAIALTNGVDILKSCSQRGKYATKYSNVFDLRNGDIFLYPSGDLAGEVKLNLARELAKGPHYFDIPQLRRQLASPLQPLLLNMYRFPLDEVRTIKDPDPAVSARIRQTLVDAAAGTIRREDFTEAFWKGNDPTEIAAEAKGLGTFISLGRVESVIGDGPGDYRYRVEFANARFVQRYALDSAGRISDCRTEAFEATAKP